MKGRYLILLPLLFSTACSTVERRTYYSPNVPDSKTDGPQRSDCGFTNIGGLPDSYSSTSTLGNITVTTNQNWHPYLWGPWFLSIVPVFPITWLVEPFIDDNLQISVKIDNAESLTITPLNITAIHNGNNLTPVEMRTFDGTGYIYYHVTFPVDYDNIESFELHISHDNNDISIPFAKANRWSWSQWTPNC